MPYITKEQKADIFKEFGGDATNTGSTEAQIALLTAEIKGIAEHIKSNKKDFSSNRGLLKKVGKRKRLLSYLAETNLQSYRSLIQKLGLRK